MADRIYINGRFLTQPVSGVQRYAREIVAALDRRPGAASRYVLVVPPAADHLPLDHIPVHKVSGARGHVWEQTTLAWTARRGRLLSLCGAGPVGHPRHVVVIHDAAVFRRPQHFHPAYGVFHRALGRLLSTRARIATVSAFSRRELASVLLVAVSQIGLVPNSADHLRTITPDRNVIARLNLADRPFFVVLGNLTPNKNIAVAIRALSHLSDPSVRLVLIGARQERVSDHPSLPFDTRVLAAGRCSDAEVAALLGHARGLVFPSRYEGFGIPPLEALALGCPVVASDIPATQEVCADAALYFDPDDDVLLAEHMTRLLDGSDPSRRNAGLRRADLYAWSRSAEILETFVLSAC